MIEVILNLIFITMRLLQTIAALLISFKLDGFVDWDWKQTLVWYWILFAFLFLINIGVLSLIIINVVNKIQKKQFLYDYQSNLIDKLTYVVK